MTSVSKTYLFGGDGIVFADWEEAGVSIPFVTIELLRKQLAQAECAGNEIQRLVSEYQECWRALLPKRIIDEVVRCTPSLAATSFLHGRKEWFTAEYRRNPDFQGFADSKSRPTNAEDPDQPSGLFWAHERWAELLTCIWTLSRPLIRVIVTR
jgi:hypothetical protein